MHVKTYYKFVGSLLGQAKYLMACLLSLSSPVSLWLSLPLILLLLLSLVFPFFTHHNCKSLAARYARHYTTVAHMVPMSCEDATASPIRRRCFIFTTANRRGSHSELTPGTRASLHHCHHCQHCHLSIVQKTILQLVVVDSWSDDDGLDFWSDDEAS